MTVEELESVFAGCQAQEDPDTHEVYLTTAAAVTETDRLMSAPTVRVSRGDWMTLTETAVSVGDYGHWVIDKDTPMARRFVASLLRKLRAAGWRAVLVSRGGSKRRDEVTTLYHVSRSGGFGMLTFRSFYRDEN